MLKTDRKGDTMLADAPWSPRRLCEIRTAAGFKSQRRLALKSGVDQQTISRIEGGGNISVETSQKLAPFLHLNHPALFIAHNLAVAAESLVRGYISLAEAKRDRNYIEQMLLQTADLPYDQYQACNRTLEQLNEVIVQLNRVRHEHTDWPGSDDPNLKTTDIGGLDPVRPLQAIPRTA